MHRPASILKIEFGRIGPMGSLIYFLAVVILLAGGILYLEWRSTRPREISKIRARSSGLVSGLAAGLKNRIDQLRGSGPFK